MSEMNFNDLNEVSGGAQAPYTAHIVKNGECLSVIAQRNGISLQTLLDANPQIKNPNQVEVGQKVLIPKKR